MDFISPIEDAIIARLKSKVPGVLVQQYPDDPEAFAPAHPVGALLVRYASAAYSEPKALDVVVQERDVLFEVTLAMWSLRGKTGQGGLYSYLDGVRVALTGYTPPNCQRKLTPTEDGFINRSSGLKGKRLWQYSISFNTTIFNIEVLDDVAVTLLKRLTTNDNYGDIKDIP